VSSPSRHTVVRNVVVVLVSGLSMPFSCIYSVMLLALIRMDDDMDMDTTNTNNASIYNNC